MNGGTPRIPPNQALAAPGRWPLVGERTARASTAPWTLTVAGLLAEPRTWTLEELNELPVREQTLDIHCVTRWSRLDVTFRGVLLADLLAACAPADDARFVSFLARSARQHSSSLALADAIELGVLLALEADGAPLAPEHGGPLRSVTPGRYFYKSVKWVERIELLAEDRLGYWEAEAGYHNHADPWREERYLAANLDRRTVARVLADLDFTGLDLRSISAADRDLCGLRAGGARLRNADFRRSDLRDAEFAGANLSNAHFTGADLRGANLTGADVEGADFAGADLRGTDLTGASLFGTTFGADPGAKAARIDSTTLVGRDALEVLTPAEAGFLRESGATLR